MKAVCKDCPDRTVEPNCHLTCRAYLEFKKTKDRIREAKQEAYNVETARHLRKRR